MARELQLDVEVTGAVEADAAIARLALAFQKAGDTAEVAAQKADKFEKSFKDGQARKKAKDELDALAGSTDKAAGAADKATGAAGKYAGATDKLTAAVLRYAGPAVALEAARRTIAWADDIEDMAKRTSISAVQVQQLTKVAEKNGSTFGAMAGLIQQAEARLVGHNKQAEAAVRLMGMAPEALLKMDPLERLRALAKGLADLKDPAQRSRLEMDVFGRSADANAAALFAVAEGADKLESALDADFIAAGAAAQDMLDDIKNKAMEMLGAIVLIGPAILLQAQQLDRARAAGQASPMMPQAPGMPGSIGGNAISDLIARRIAEEQNRLANPSMPKGPDLRWLGFPSPLGVPGSPMEGAAGQSWGFLNRVNKLRASGGTGAKILPFTRNQWAGISQVLGPSNPMGNGGLGGFPGWALPDVLASSMSRSAMGIGFDRNSSMVPFAGTVPMNAPGGAGGGLGGFLSGHKTQIAGMGLGLLSRFIPQGGRVGSALSMASQGASMGAMFGPWGMGIGAALGGITGLFTGGKAAKNARNAETSKVFEQFSTPEFVEMQKQAERFGISMDKALKAKTMKDFGLAVDEVNQKLTKMASIQAEIDDLTERTKVGFDEMNAIVNEFGLDVSKLGPAFQQAMTDKDAQRIIDAMAVMEKGGADMSGVLDGMADEISKVVQDSLKFGTTIPENMKPWVESLIKSGKLLDENGVAITDISKVKWGAAMESDMSKLTKKLDELIVKLGEIAAGFRDATGAATDLSNVDVGGGTNPNGPTSGSGNNESGFATGGMAGRDFRRPGHGDIFPALLRRGETVLPPGVSRGGVSLSIGNLSVSGGYRSRTDAVEEIGEAVVRYVERRGGRLVA